MIKGAKVTLGLYDNSIDEDTNVASQSTESEFAKTEKVLQNYDLKKVAYLEKDYFLLDGSFILPQESQQINVGWESANLSDVNGNVNEYIQFAFEKTHASFGIQIDFPKETVTKDFDIVYIGNTGNELLRTKVTNNTRANYSDFNTAIDWKTVRIEFKKIANSFQRTRLSSLYLGILDTYTEDLLVEITASRTTDLTADNTDSGEISYRMFNAGRFNIKNITDLPEGIQHDVKMVAFFKDETGKYKEFGHYISKETSVSEDGRIVDIKGYDPVYDLNTTFYDKGIVYLKGRSLKAWAEEVAADAGIELIVDPAFDKIISKGYIPYTTHREALRRIAEAGCGILTIDNKGKIYLKKLAPLRRPDITADDIIDNTLQNYDENKVLGVNVKNYVYGVGKKVGIAEIKDILLTREPQVIEVEYAAAPVDVTTISIEHDAESGIEIVEQHLYSDRARFVVKGPEGAIAWITMLGNVYSVAMNLIAKGSVMGNIKSIDNPLIAGTKLANDVAEYQYNRIIGVYDYSADILTDIDYDIEDQVSLNGKSVIITKIQKSMTNEDAKDSIVASQSTREVNTNV